MIVASKIGPSLMTNSINLLIKDKILLSLGITTLTVARASIFSYFFNCLGSEGTFMFPASRPHLSEVDTTQLEIPSTAASASFPAISLMARYCFRSYPTYFMLNWRSWWALSKWAWMSPLVLVL